MQIEFEPEFVRIGLTVHLAARAVDRETGRSGPRLTAEGCNFDDTLREAVVVDEGVLTEANRCQRCNIL